MLINKWDDAKYLYLRFNKFKTDMFLITSEQFQIEM
jgi:hypothetical protein